MKGEVGGIAFPFLIPGIGAEGAEVVTSLRRGAVLGMLLGASGINRPAMDYKRARKGLGAL